MSLPQDNNPLFEDDNYGDNSSNSSNQIDKYFDSSNDPAKVTFKTDSGEEMSLNYNINDVNGRTGDKRKAPQDQNNLIDIINNEKELDKINNPWMKESYNLAKKFYEADSKLESQDRAELTTIFNNIRNSQILGMKLTMISVLTIPYVIIYKKYGGGGLAAFKQGGTNPAGRAALLNLNRKFPRIFVFSLFGLIVGGNVAGSLRYDVESDRLENEMMDNENKYNQYQLFKMTAPLEAIKWSHYYKITSIDETRRLRNPGEQLGSVVDYYKQLHGGEKNTSGEEGSFNGGVWQKNPFHHVDVEKSQDEEFQRTGVRTQGGIPVSPYSKRYSQQEPADKPNAASELESPPDSSAFDSKVDNADLDDPFFQKQEEDKKKKKWW